MNPPGFPAGGNLVGGNPPSSSKKELRLQGPRPPPLKVSKDSHDIKKPPLPPPAASRHHHQQQQQRAAAPEARNQQREPVIIYSVPPRVIHVAASDFKDLVQRLTGLPPNYDNDPVAGAGDVLPAARIASIEKTSQTEKDKSPHNEDDRKLWMLQEGVEIGQFPGVLSPAPGTLPNIPPEYFSPAVDPQPTSIYGDFWSLSPSGLLSAAVVSPQPSPNLFNIFND